MIPLPQLRWQLWQDASVVDVAKAWTTYLFLPSQFPSGYIFLQGYITKFLAIFKADKIEPSGSQSLTFDEIVTNSEDASRSD